MRFPTKKQIGWGFLWVAVTIMAALTLYREGYLRFVRWDQQRAFNSFYTQLIESTDLASDKVWSWKHDKDGEEYVIQCGAIAKKDVPVKE